MPKLEKFHTVSIAEENIGGHGVFFVAIETTVSENIRKNEKLNQWHTKNFVIRGLEPATSYLSHAWT